MILTFSQICLRRGRRMVLDGISASLSPGQITVILGPNGAGKSSLMMLAAGLLRPDQGSVLLDGRDLGDWPARERARHIGYLPQSAELHWNLRAADLVALGRSPRRGLFGPLGSEDHDAVEQAMVATDTLVFADRLAGTLSGGERARVMLARVLAGEPDWILADEPLASLDPAHQFDMLDALRAIADAGAGVVLVLHDLAHAARVADRILLLDSGRQAGFGAPWDLLTVQAIAQVYGVIVELAEGPDGRMLPLVTGRASA